MFIVKRGKIIELKNAIFEGGRYTVELENGKTFKTDVSNVLETIEEAKLKRREIISKKKFKRYNINRYGKLICSCCKVTEGVITVDHIKSLHSLGGEKAIRRDYNTWKKAWSFKNYQLLCRDCNNKKNTATNQEYKSVLKNLDKKAQRLAYRKTKLISRGSKDGQKCSFGKNYGKNNSVGERLSKNRRLRFNATEVDIQIARMDSRIIPLNLIL